MDDTYRRNKLRPVMDNFKEPCPFHKPPKTARITGHFTALGVYYI